MKIKSTSKSKPVNSNSINCYNININVYQNKKWIDDYISKLFGDLSVASEAIASEASEAVASEAAISDAVILAYTNNRCNYLNNYIRNKIFSQVNNQYQENEQIVFNNYYKTKNYYPEKK